MPCRGAESAKRIGGVAALVAAAATLAAVDPGTLDAEPAPLATRSLLLDIARAGGQLVAVGDRGHVLLSTDDGASWEQAQKVPTQNLLTGVCFYDEKRGIAVGHDEIVLATQDAGRTWERKHYEPAAQRPLLDVWCGDDGRAIAVGAYGAYFVSTDFGSTWMPQDFEPKPPAGTKAAAAGELDEGELGDPHLNRIAAASPSRFYIAAEAGHLYRSDDGGASWSELTSPYEGSFFGVTPLAADSVLAYGLRGNLFRSDDAGASWRRLETGTVAMLNDAVALPGGDVAIVGLSGVVLTGGKGGERFELSQQSDRKGLSAAVAVAGDVLVTVGEAGVKVIHIGTRPATAALAARFDSAP